MWTITGTEPLLFRDAQEERKKEKLLAEKASNLPKEAVEFLANRFANTN